MKKLIFIMILLSFMPLILANDFGINNLEIPQLTQETFGGYPTSFFMPLNKSVTGNYSFNGGWASGGVSIIDGDIYAQTGYFYNITSLNITQANLTILNDAYFNGKVGIGTTSPSQKLEIKNGNILINSSSNIHLYLAKTGSTAGMDFWTDVGSGLSYIDNDWDSASGKTIFRMRGQGTPVNTMTLQGDGNVGIGTTTPSKTLSVKDASDTQALFYGYGKGGVSDSNGQIRLGSHASYYGLIDYNQSGNTIFSIDNILSNANARIDLSIARNPKLTVLGTGGKVGIGTTSPQHKLQIGDGTSATSYSLAFKTHTNAESKIVFEAEDGSDRWTISADLDNVGASDLLKFGKGTSDPKMTIKGTGNVGIGTSSPTGKLEVQSVDIADSALGTGAVQGRFLTTNSAALGKGGVITLGGSYTGTTKTGFGAIRGELTALDGQQNGELSFFTNLAGTGMTEKMRIDNNGNVGIGTTSPSQSLHVVGNLNVTGNIYVGGCIQYNYNTTLGVCI